MNQLIKKEELLKARGNELYVKETAEQIIKDFALFGMDISFSGNVITAYDELFKQLEVHVSYLLTNNHDKLLALLYQIDLSEKKLREELSSDSMLSEIQQIAELIIQRELLKVLTRHYFKSQE